MRTLPRNEDPTGGVAASPKSAALVGLALVLPFAILEALNQTITKQTAPGLSTLFGLLWLLPTAFIFILAPTARNLRAGHGLMANPINFLLRVALLALIAVVWGGLLIDQMPCFMGVPNCD